MTPLRQRMIEDMQLRGLTPQTQRNYVHHVAAFARYFGKSPEVLDLEAIRQYQLYLPNQRKLSPETINQYISSIKFLYLVTLEMPWTDEYFPRVRRAHTPALPHCFSPLAGELRPWANGASISGECHGGSALHLRR